MIFNKANKGNEEIKERIGFIYKSSTYSNLVPYLDIALWNLNKIIGKSVYDLAEAHYLSNDYLNPGTDPEKILKDHLVKLIQQVLAVSGYRLYAPSADVTHSDKGRQIFVSENEKPAFEWMIDKDNVNLTRVEYTYYDILLEWLDEHIADSPIDTVWANSDYYNATKELLINSAQEFDNIFPIGRSRRLFISLQPFIRMIQDASIRPCLVAADYNAIMQIILDRKMNDPANAEFKEIWQLAIVPLALLSMSVAAIRLGSEILPEGIFQNYVSGVINGKNAAQVNDRLLISDALKSDGEKKILLLQEHLRKREIIAQGGTYTPIDPTDRMDPDEKFFRL